jgi:hypothetical protein
MNEITKMKTCKLQRLYDKLWNRVLAAELRKQKLLSQLNPLLIEIQSRKAAANEIAAPSDVTTAPVDISG